MPPPVPECRPSSWNFSVPSRALVGQPVQLGGDLHVVGRRARTRWDGRSPRSRRGPVSPRAADAPVWRHRIALDHDGHAGVDGRLLEAGEQIDRRLRWSAAVGGRHAPTRPAPRRSAPSGSSGRRAPDRPSLGSLPGVGSGGGFERIAVDDRFGQLGGASGRVSSGRRKPNGLVPRTDEQPWSPQRPATRQPSPFGRAARRAGSTTPTGSPTPCSSTRVRSSRTAGSSRSWANGSMSTGSERLSPEQVNGILEGVDRARRQASPTP